MSSGDKSRGCERRVVAWPGLRRLFLISFLAILPVQIAAAHPIVVYDGIVTVNESGMKLRVEADPHILEHELGGHDAQGRMDESKQRYAMVALISSIIVRDAAGRVWPVSDIAVTFTDERIVATAEIRRREPEYERKPGSERGPGYQGVEAEVADGMPESDFSGHSGIVSIEHVPGNTLGPVRRRIDLILSRSQRAAADVSGDASRGTGVSRIDESRIGEPRDTVTSQGALKNIPSTRLLQLTSGGNYEVISLTGQPLVDSDRFIRPRLNLLLDDGGEKDGGKRQRVRVSVDFPLSTLPYGVRPPGVGDVDEATRDARGEESSLGRSFASWAREHFRTAPVEPVRLVEDVIVGPDGSVLWSEVGSLESEPGEAGRFAKSTEQWLTRINTRLVRARVIFEFEISAAAGRLVGWSGFPSGLTVLDVYRVSSDSDGTSGATPGSDLGPDLGADLDGKQGHVSTHVGIFTSASRWIELTRVWPGDDSMSSNSSSQFRSQPDLQPDSQ